MGRSSSQGKGSKPLLGRVIRQARRAQKLNKQQLGEPEFTQAYINAVERGSVIPSAKALELLAQRLKLPLDVLHNTLQRLQVEPDLHAFQEDLHFQLDYANTLVHSGQIEEALESIATAEAGVREYWTQLYASSQYRIPYMRGMAYIERRMASKAQAELEASLELVVKPGSGSNIGYRDSTVTSEEIMARVRNLLGVAFYLQGDMVAAEKQHRASLRAVQEGNVRDRNLRLSIYRNLANDYWASNKPKKALIIYRETLRLFDDAHDPRRLAGVYWGMALAHKALNERALAKLHTKRALDIYKEEGLRTEAAMLSMNLAEMLIEDDQYPEAQACLDNARGLLTPPVPGQQDRPATADEPLWCNLYQDYARLARRQLQLDVAAEYAAKSMQLGEMIHERVTADGTEASGYPARNYAETLHMAALIEEDRGNSEIADGLFQQAMTVVRETDFVETWEAITSSYAAVLKARGDYEKAMRFFDIALQSRMDTDTTPEDLEF